MSQGPLATVVVPPLDELEPLELPAPPELLELPEELELVEPPELLEEPELLEPPELPEEPELLPEEPELPVLPELLVEPPPELLAPPEPLPAPELLPEPGLLPVPELLAEPPELLLLSAPLLPEAAPPELLPGLPASESPAENDPHAARTAPRGTATNIGTVKRVFFIATSPVAWATRHQMHRRACSPRSPGRPGLWSIGPDTGILPGSGRPRPD
jgi:hypothetical protein